MPTIQESLRPFPRLHNSLVPTPAHRLDYLSDKYGVNVYCKRGYIGEGYAARTAGCREAVEMFARRFGIFLDYVYTGKAAAALVDYLRKGHFAQGANVLFIHTGGNIELFE